jgi:tRNA(fMet)-specific endonuclease VapC
VAGLVVVDTDLVIDFLRGRGAGAPLVRELVTGHRLRLTAITVLELRLGADFLARRDDVLRLVRSRTFPLDFASALRAGEVAATLRAAGQDIGMADCLQAGICLRFGLPFATRNRKHFSRVAGLRLVEVG